MSKTTKNTYYITTPLYYTNGKLHIGHCFTTIIADAMARYKREKGFDVMFLTGLDEHGQKMEQAAQKKGMSPQEYVDAMADGVKNLWTKMEISYDRFIRTTDEDHKRRVTEIYRQLVEKGDIYLGEYEGYYCVPDEAYWTKTQLIDGKCPTCHREVSLRKESSYFLRLSEYQKDLMEVFEQYPNILEPQARINEMVNNFIKPGVDDLSISRTNFEWGIPVPNDSEHVIYVWVDALSNYITALGYPNQMEDGMTKYWPADLQLMSKEIVRFHTVIWFSILKALNLPLPKKLFSHGWLLFDGEKMGKSTGNTVDPEILIERYGVDAIKYFLLSEYELTRDGQFSEDLLVQRINSNLANDFGNLLSRTVAMVIKYREGVIPSCANATAYDEDLISQAEQAAKAMDQYMDQIQINKALDVVWQLIRRANKYIDETMPWVLAKEDPQNQLDTVLYNLVDILRMVGTLIRPFMPATVKKMEAQLGFTFGAREEAEKVGCTPSGVTVQKGAVLFPRIDREATK